MSQPGLRLVIRIYRRLPKWARRFVIRRATPSYSVGAMCVVEREDGALLLLRNSYRDGWGLPGGLLRRGEAAHDAARREVVEEVGIDIELLGRPAVYVDAKARRVDVIFRARPSSAGDETGAEAASPEVTEARWFPADELPRMQLESTQALEVLRTAP